MRSFLGVCFSWRVLAGLGVVALSIWLYAPQLVGAALPILVLLVCPLSMLLMAWMMRGSMPMAAGTSTPADRLAQLERQQTQIGAEVARVRAELDASTLPTASRSPKRSES